MNKHETTILNINIDNLSKRIESYIKTNIPDKLINYHDIRNLLLRKYLILTTYKNEYIAKEYLSKIEESFAIYDRNQETRKIISIKNKIDKNIESFIKDIEIQKEKQIVNKVTANKKTLETFFTSNKYSIYDLSFSGARFYIYIDNEKNKYEIISFNRKKRSFNNRRFLLNYLFDNITPLDGGIQFNINVYKKKEFTQLARNIERWDIDEKFLSKQIINNIKLNEIVKINENLSIKLVESYSYKQIFIVKNDKANTEILVHVYTDNIEKATSIISENNYKIKNKSELLMYQKNNKWIVEKKNKSGVIFAQGKDFISPLKNMLERINVAASSYTGQLLEDVMGGFCYGLSLRYLIEVRNAGVEGAENYLKWLKKSAELYKNKPSENKVGGFYEVLQRNIYEYNLMQLTEETKNIIIAHNYQKERIKGQKYLYNDLNGKVPYSSVLSDVGLSPINKEKPLLSEDVFFKKIDGLLTGNDNRYIFIGYKQHQTAITYKKYSDGNYKVTFFEPRFGIFEFDNIEDLKKIIKEKQKIYGLYEQGGIPCYGFDEFVEVSSKKYNPLFSNEKSSKSREVFRNKGIAEKLKTIDFSLEFSKDSIGRVMHYDENGILIVQIKHNNKLIEISVVEPIVEDGLFLIKENINKIIEHQNASKIILKKTNNNIAITPIEFNPVWADKRLVGYIEFNRNNYISIIGNSLSNFKGIIKFDFEKIKNLINKLDSNIYFEKLKSSLELLNAISIFTNQYKDNLVNNKLIEIKSDIENRLFFGRLQSEKNKIIAMAEKNSIIATKLYQSMVNGVNNGNINDSKFVYDRIITHKYLIEKISRPQGVANYDYTIVFDNHNHNLKEIINDIDINQLKNRIYLDGDNQLNLRINYNELILFNNNKSVKELLSIIDKEIDKHRDGNSKSNQEIFSEKFINNDYVNRILQLEFDELSNFVSTTENQVFTNNDEYPYFDNTISESTIKRIVIDNIKKTGVGFILFENNKKNIEFILDNQTIIMNNVKKIIIDLIPQIYQVDLNNYLQGIKNNARISNLLKANDSLRKLVDTCAKNNISIIATGESSINGVHNEFISKNLSIKNFHHIITENTMMGEGVLVIADKDKLYNFKDGIIHVEGLANKLNTPICNVVNKEIRRSQTDTVYTNTSTNHRNDRNENMDIIISEFDIDEPIICEIKNDNKIKEYFSNVVYSNKIYEKLSILYPEFRRDKNFLLGYKDDIKMVIYNYSQEMTTKEILEYIELNKYSLTKKQLGAIVREIDLRTYQSGLKTKQNKNFTRLFDKINQNNGIDKKAIHSFFPQQQILLNLKDGSEGRCEALTILMLVAKHLEHTGDIGRVESLINNLMLAQSVINHDVYDEYKFKRSSQELIASLNELSENHHRISTTVGLNDNNKRSLDYVINKLTNKKLNSDGCYLQLYTSNHVITAWANLDKKNNNFGFYDPNFGLVEFSSKKKFISYLNDFFKSKEINAGKIYSLEKNIKNKILFDKVLDINVKSLSKIKIKNKSLDNIVGSNIINYRGVNNNSHENIDFSYNVKYKESIINSKKVEGGLLTINTAEVNGYYSFADTKIATSRKVVLLLADDNDLNSHYLNFSQEYHRAGYDLFIVDGSTDVDAGKKAFEYLKARYNADTDSILLHGHNRSGEQVIDLYQSLNKKGYFPEGIVLSSSNNDLISVVNKIGELNFKANIYIAYDHQITDENNLFINRNLKSFGHEVKEFSFSQREEYNRFSDARYRQQDPTRKFSSYQSRNLILLPIEKEPAPVIGMPDNDQKIFRQIANSENVIVGVRPIDVQSTSLIKSKQYSSKGLLIKGKSADWGPMAGFIPVDQSFAKLSARNDVTKYNLAIQGALDKGHAITIPLILSSERIRELHHNNILQLPELLTDTIQVTCSVDNRDYDFYLSKSNQDGEIFYTVNYYDNEKLVPVHVLGDPISKKPMIADYDLFTVMYSYNDLSETTIVKKPVSWEEWKSSVDYEKLSPTYQEYYNNKDLYDRYEGEQLGIISAHVKKVKDKINTSLQRGKEMIHHGADDANHFSVITDNFPATFFVPDELLNKVLNSDNNTLKDFFIINENNTIIIRNIKEFSDFQQLVINNGFISPLNEKWNEGIGQDYFSKRRKNSENFINNSKALDKIFSVNYKNNYQSSLDDINNKYFNRVFELIKNNHFENIIYTNSEQANKEIALLKSAYQHAEAIKNYMDGDGVYNKLSISLKKKIHHYKKDLDWFKRGGYKLFDYIISDQKNYLNRTDATRLNNVFNIILELPEIKGSIYKSIYVENLSSYTKNIEAGSVITTSGVLRANRNPQKIKKNESNVFISIVGTHNARTLTGISDRFTDQVMVAPGKHYRVISQKKENNKLYIVLEATDILVKSEPIFDLYNANLKGFAVDTHRSTATETLETVISDKQLLDTVNKINNEFIDTTVESNFIDKIINKKLTPEYAEYRYAQELSSIFGAEKDYISMLNEIINDPLSNKKYNQYVNNKISREEWLESFSHHYYSNNSLNEKTINIKILVEAINDMPSCINLLSDASKSLLMEFFSCDFNSLNGKLLRIVSSQESYDDFTHTIERMKFYLTQETNFKGDSIHDVFYKVLRTENDKQNYKDVILALKKKLLQSPQNKNKYQTSILRLPFEYNNEITSLLTLLYSGLNKEMSHDTLMEHIRLLEVLYKKSSSNQLNQEQAEYLSVFNSLLNDIYNKKEMSGYMTKIIDGELNNKITQLPVGHYLLDINGLKINLNIVSTEDDGFIFHVFIAELGDISITGNNKEQITSDLFSFLHQVDNVKNNITLDNSSEKLFLGTIYRVDGDGIIPTELFNKMNVLKNNIITNINKQNFIEINGVNINKDLLFHLGCQIEGKSIISVDLHKTSDWQNKLRFDADKLNDFFLSASGSDDDKQIVSLFRKLLKNKEKNIKNILSVDTSRIDYMAAKERLTKIIELNDREFDFNYWHELRNPSLKIPRHMRIISKVGYANIGFGIWQTMLSTMKMVESIESGKLTPLEHKEMVKNLAIMWSEMAYNGFSEIIEIVVAKGMLRHRANPAEYVGKISTRIGIALNILSVGFDIYNAYDNFSQIACETDTRKKIDYIVNGTFAVVSALVTIGVSIAILAGSTVAGPIGIVIGAAITTFLAIYNAVRVIEEAKKRVNFTIGEEIENGLSVVFLGDLTPSKKNEMTLLDTKDYFRNRTDEVSKDFHEKLIKSNPKSYYFYTNEEYHYQEKYYYSVKTIFSQDPTGIINNGLISIISNHLSKLYKKEEAENIASEHDTLVSVKTNYKYYEPEYPIPTNEKIIFDLDFYVDELYKYNVDLETNEYLTLMRNTKDNINLDKQNPDLGLLNVNEVQAIYDYLGDSDDVFYFNTNNGNDIISAPKNAINTFDIFNGVKRLSGGNKNDNFNLFITHAPEHASRFYGREGIDTLHIVNKSPLYTGYNINLRDNYIKFCGSENQPNSIGFKPSKIYYFDAKTGVTSPFIMSDSMPNVSLQTDRVIAYLDSFENIIGSANGDDILVGNDEDNYIDGVSGHDRILGLKGNDIIKLSEGSANGGEGNDIYIISRLNNSYKDKKNISIIIDEGNEKDKVENESNIVEQNIIKLEHNFKDIKSIKRVGGDIVVILDNGFVDNKDKIQTPLPLTSVTLKNMFTNDTGYELLKNYCFITNDGFVLNFNNNVVNKSDPLFYFSYIESHSNLHDKYEYIFINNEERKFNVRSGTLAVKHNILPELEYSGLSDGNALELSIEGDSNNNTYLAIDNHSRIRLTAGVDIYQLKTFIAQDKDEYVEVLPNKNNLDENIDNISTFILPDVSGYDLKFENGAISHRYNPDGHSRIDMNVSQWGLRSILHSGIKIRVIDKYGKMFILPDGDSSNQLLTPIVKEKLSITQSDDSIIIPENRVLNKIVMDEFDVYSSPELQKQAFLSNLLKHKSIPNIMLLPVIDLLAGNDIVINKNQGCSVIVGGKGNDTLIVEGGHHILFANEGNDKLFGGKGNDVLISDTGNDYLDGGEGNDIYLINKHHGEVMIDDSQGDNTLFITGLNKDEMMSSSRDDNDEILCSLDNTFIVRIKNKYKESQASYQIEQRERVLTDEALVSIIHEMAQFNQNQLSSMKGAFLPEAQDWTLLPIITQHLT